MKMLEATRMNPGLENLFRDFVVGSQLSQNELDRMISIREALAGSVATQIDNFVDERSLALVLGEAIVTTANATLSAATAGTLFWVLRGAAVVMTLASGMPALRSLDPANLLADYRAARLTREDEEIEGMVNAADDTQKDKV